MFKYRQRVETSIGIGWIWETYPQLHRCGVWLEGYRRPVFLDMDEIWIEQPIVFNNGLGKTLESMGVGSLHEAVDVLIKRGVCDS